MSMSDMGFQKKNNLDGARVGGGSFIQVFFLTFGISFNFCKAPNVLFLHEWIQEWTKDKIASTTSGCANQAPWKKNVVLWR